MMFNIPGQSVTKKRNTYASLFDRFSASGDTEITEEQKASLFRKGLLNFAINSLGTKGQGFGGAAAAGLSGGLLAMDEGAQQIGNDRYKNEILARTRQGMERNTQMEQLAKQYMGADGQFDHEGYANALAQYDPQASLEYKTKLQPPGRKNPGAPVYLASADGQYEDPYFWDENEGRLVPAQQFLGQGGPQVAAQPQQGGAGFDNLVGGLLKREGGYVADDAGKGPTNFGINSAANPDVDVRNLTPEKAMELYRQRYWLPIGGDNLPPAIQSAALDAAVNQGPERAKQWIAMAGNDPRKFAELRQAHYDGLVASNPQKYGQYADSWRNRNMETAGIAPPRQSQVPPGAFGRRPVKGKEAAERYRTLSAQEVKDLGLPSGTVAQASPSGQVQIINKPKDLPGAQTQVIENEDGTQTIIPAGKTTEDQNKSAGYALRMENALASIAESAQANPGANKPGLGMAAIDMLPDALGNFIKPQERQNIEAAQLDALDAALTLNTGAAYTKEQLFSLRKSYFPQPGDAPKTIEQKAARLQGLIKTARLRARGAYPNTGPQGTPPPAPSAPKRLKYNPATGKLE